MPVLLMVIAGYAARCRCLCRLLPCATVEALPAFFCQVMAWPWWLLHFLQYVFFFFGQFTIVAE